MIGPHPIEGYAIVSADGMIADADGAMPDCIRNDADQHFLQAAMDRAAAIVHGRRSHEGGPRAAERKRVVVTRQIPAIAAERFVVESGGREPRAGYGRARRRYGFNCRHRRNRRVQSVPAALRCVRRAREFRVASRYFRR